MQLRTISNTLFEISIYVNCHSLNIYRTVTCTEIWTDCTRHTRDRQWGTNAMWMSNLPESTLLYTLRSCSTRCQCCCYIIIHLVAVRHQHRTNAITVILNSHGFVWVSVFLFCHNLFWGFHVFTLRLCSATIRNSHCAPDMWPFKWLINLMKYGVLRKLSARNATLTRWRTD